MDDILRDDCRRGLGWPISLYDINGSSVDQTKWPFFSMHGKENPDPTSRGLRREKCQIYAPSSERIIGSPNHHFSGILNPKPPKP